MISVVPTACGQGAWLRGIPLSEEVWRGMGGPRQPGAGPEGPWKEREAYRALGCHGKAGKARGWAALRRDVLREGWREDGGGMLAGAPQMSSAQGLGGFWGATCGKACRSVHGEDGPAA